MTHEYKNSKRCAIFSVSHGRVFWDVRSCCSTDVLPSFSGQMMVTAYSSKMQVSTVFTIPHSVTSRRYIYDIYTVQRRTSYDIYTVQRRTS